MKCNYNNQLSTPKQSQKDKQLNFTHNYYEIIHVGVVSLTGKLKILGLNFVKRYCNRVAHCMVAYAIHIYIVSHAHFD